VRNFSHERHEALVLVLGHLLSESELSEKVVVEEDLLLAWIVEGEPLRNVG
jgi:hypothetical protein